MDVNTPTGNLSSKMFPNNGYTNFAPIGQPWDGGDYNWVEETTNDGAVQQDFSLSARGGTQTTNFLHFRWCLHSGRTYNRFQPGAYVR